MIAPIGLTPEGGIGHEEKNSKAIAPRGRGAGRKKPYIPPLVKKHTVKDTIQILTGAGVGSASAEFAA